jgi:ATP-dependent exoDNAse (exonuclease V) beta subunit
LTIDSETVSIGGIIDLLHITPETAEIIDYKTDRTTHAEAEYRKQLSVYYHVVADQYPDRTVSASIFYTADGTRSTIDPISQAALTTLVTSSHP